MSSKLTIIFNTKGSVVEKDKTFTPNMVYQKNKSSQILFPPTVKITQSLIRNSITSTKENAIIFTSPLYFSHFMSYATNKRRFKAITLQDAKDNGVVQHNFEFFRKTFLKKEKHIYIAGRAYTIISSKLNMENPKVQIPTSKEQGLNYVMCVDLTVIDKKNDTYYNRTKTNCSERKKDINDMWTEFFGIPFFESGLPNKRNSSELAPVMFTNNMGIAESKRPNKLIPLHKMYPPYAQPGIYNPYNTQPNYPIAHAQPVIHQRLNKPFSQVRSYLGGAKKKQTKRRKLKKKRKKKKNKGTRKVNRRRR